MCCESKTSLERDSVRSSIFCYVESLMSLPLLFIADSAMLFPAREAHFFGATVDASPQFDY